MIHHDQEDTMSTDYNARIDYATRDDIDEQLVDALAGYSPATERTTTGYAGVHITLPAADLAQATTTALALAARACDVPVLALEVMTTAEFDARVEADPTEGTASVAEAAALLGVTPSAIRQRLASGSLPGQREGRDWRIPRGALPVPSRHSFTEEQVKELNERKAARKKLYPPAVR